jgi:hypothetical protein
MMKSINGRLKQVSVNVYVALLWRLAAVFFLFSISRLLFYALNTEYFPGLTFRPLAKDFKRRFSF